MITTNNSKETKLNFCPCCRKDKEVTKFYLNKAKTSYSKFCKTCYVDYNKTQRKLNEIKFINSCLLSIAKKI